MTDDGESLEARRARRSTMWTRTVRGFSPELDIEDDRYWLSLTPSERVALVWSITLDAWELAGEKIGAQRLRRDLARVHRR
jgi:hypothetical protein